MNIDVLLIGLLPVFSIILLGSFLKRYIITNESQWSGMERITFVLLTPCLIIKTLIEADLTEFPIGSITIVFVTAVFAMILILMALYSVLTKKCQTAISAYTSVFQTSIRWNAFVAVAIVANLYGGTGVAITALAMIILMPIINIVNVIMLVFLLTQGRLSFSQIFLKIITNPIIIGCFVGLAISTIGIPIWQPAMETLSILGTASLGVILLSVGAGIKLADISHSKRDLFVSCILKLIVMPAMVLNMALSLGLNGLVLVVAVIISAMPTASNGYILAREMGGDAQLYANATSIQVLLSFVTIPLWLEIVALVQI